MSYIIDETKVKPTMMKSIIKRYSLQYDWVDVILNKTKRIADFELGMRDFHSTQTGRRNIRALFNKRTMQLSLYEWVENKLNECEAVVLPVRVDN